jgi:phenylacetate-CoA ligase
MSLTEITYPFFQTLLELTVRRDYLCEKRRQQRWRTQDAAMLLRFSREQAVIYANRMAVHSRGYRARLDAAGIRIPIDDSPETWLKLPTLTKADYQQNPESWYSDDLDRDAILWSCTSGSSGEPYRFPQDSGTTRAEWASHELTLRAVGWRPGWREAVIKIEIPPLTGYRRLFRAVMGNTPLTLPAVAFRAREVQQHVERLRRGRIQFLRGYSLAIVLLAEEIIRQRVSCPIPIILTFGEGLSERQAEVIETAFGGKVYRDYGGSEAMHIGFQCRIQKGYHLNLSRFKLEILDGDRPVKSGETGEIVVTHFRNHAMPFVRYRMGDLGTLADPAERCACGCTYPLITEVAGRVNDAIQMPNRHTLDVHFLFVLDYAHEHISAFRVIQKEPDLLEILFVPRHAQAREHLARIEQQIRDLTEGSMRIRWTAVRAISPDPSGKRRTLVPLPVYQANRERYDAVETIPK